MKNQETPARNRNVENLYKMVAAKIHGNYVEYALLENKLKELKEGGPLTYDHLLYIADTKNWPSFTKWYRWPEKDQLVEGLAKTRNLFVDLKEYKNLPGNEQIELDRELFNKLFKIIKNIELVSIILLIYKLFNVGFVG